MSVASSTANQLYAYDLEIAGHMLDFWVQLVHKEFSKASGWGCTPLKPGSFGYDNFACSIGHCFDQVFDSDQKDSVTVEMAADWVHKGWILNYVFWRDHQPYKKNKLYTKPAKPLGDARRDMCASTPYKELPKDEQEKDELIASILLKNIGLL